MTKPVTPQDMFDLWSKMVNPGGYPMQSLMFPVLDAKEVERKIGELQVVEQWLRANLNMLQMSIKSLQYQGAMLKGGEKFQASLREGRAAAEGAADSQGDAAKPPNPAMWAWEMMARAGEDAMKAAAPATPKPKARKRKPK